MTKIDTITIHCMAGQLSVETCGNVFAQSKAQASSNYGVSSECAGHTKTDKGSAFRRNLY